MPQVLIAVVVTLIFAVPVTYFSTISYRKRVVESKIGSAEEKAREIIDEAVKTAETKKRESLLEIKEESIRTKNDLDKEIKERRNEIQRNERRIIQKEENLDKKLEAIEKKESGFAAKEEEINRQKAEVTRLHEERVQELERISGLTSEQAKDYLLKMIEDDVKLDTAKLIKEMEIKAKEEAGKKAKEYVVTAIQKCAADHVAETTISVVQLPNDEMKGRIIGREGRNIRTLETMTGVDLIIDDTPEAVILSGFDPVRREVARIALEKLIVDGRIHPARIEEMVEKAQKEVETMIREEGEAATLEVGVHGIHPELVRLLGKMKFRTSYGQNALKHSIEVAQLSGLLAAEIGVDVVKSGLLPADKVAEVEALLAEKGRKEKLAFVGDGINDAPVLSRADLGIAMGALGADAAIEAADIVLMDDNPEKIATAIGISRKTLRIVYQNIIFALAVKFICLGLGAAGTLNMWWAIFADVGVMIIAVLNATRALYYKE